MTVGRIPSVEGGIQPTLLTAKGDLISATAASTVARLPVGSDTQILVADSTASTGLKWATPAAAASGLTLISRQTFSNVATTTTTFDGVFTSTYKTYMVVIEKAWAATPGDDLLVQFRYAGPTTQATGYYGSLNYATYNAAYTHLGISNASALTLTVAAGPTGESTKATMYFVGVGNTSEQGSLYGQGITGYNESQNVFGGGPHIGSQTYTGFILSSTSSNISGTVAVYGLATA
jgi:hypothetical protein